MTYPALTNDLVGVVCQLSQMAMQSFLLGYNQPLCHRTLVA